MGGQALRLGPFTGALNTASDPTAIADAELVKLENFELDIDGSLISRTPIQELQGHVNWSERIVIIGEGIFSGIRYVIGSNINGVFYYTGGVWTLITNTFQATVAIQYANTVYLVSRPGSGNGGKWDPIGGFTAVAAIPKGQAAVIHKERLFIAPGVAATTNQSRLSFSDAGNFDSWPGSNFIDIGQGDGTNLIDLTVFQDNLLLFKNQATYNLAYDIRPTDATVRKISSTIGAEKQFCVVNYENQVYVFHGGWVYEIINFDFNRLNTKVPFERNETVPAPFAAENVFISIFEDRLVCRYFHNVYVYGLRTRTWSVWSSQSNSLQYFGPIWTSRQPTGSLYYAGSSVSSHIGLFKFVNKQTSTDKERGFNTETTISDAFGTVIADSWGNTDTGEAWITTGGSSTDFDKAGGKGTMSLTSVNVFRAAQLNVSIADVNEVVTVSTSALAVGAQQGVELQARADSGFANLYMARLTFNTDATMSLIFIKRIANVQSSLVTVNTGLTHVANTNYSIRFRVQGTQIQARVWLSSGPEPNTWNINTTDTDLAAPGRVSLRSVLFTGNTNPLPVTVSFDDYRAVNLVQTDYLILCAVKTKNFDMAISHQFKRLWWWGVDTSTANQVTGIATPIILAFSVVWRQLETRTWRSLENNRWAQPLTEASSIITIITGAGRAARRFAKFNKALRYRQINFEVKLQTDGSTVDGPARLFTMTIITESKATVPKAVN